MPKIQSNLTKRKRKESEYEETSLPSKRQACENIFSDKEVGVKEFFASKKCKTDHQLTNNSSKETNRNRNNANSKIEIGRRGEEFCLKILEKRHRDAQVVWVNKDQESRLPYDIKLVLPDDTVKYIEVKATSFRKMTKFILTENEFEFMKEKQDDYLLYLISLRTGEWTKIDKAYLKFGGIELRNNSIQPNNFKIKPIRYRIEWKDDEQLNLMKI